MPQGLLLGLLLATLSIAPAQPEKPSAGPSLLERRLNAAQKLYDISWVYWREKRIYAPTLYSCSLELLRAERDLRQDAAGWQAAFEAHEKRFKQMESLIQELQRKRVVTSSLDVAAVEYYRFQIEIERERQVAP
jgi:hypothetical protein